LVLTCIGIE